MEGFHDRKGRLINSYLKKMLPLLSRQPRLYRTKERKNQHIETHAARILFRLLFKTTDIISINPMGDSLYHKRMGIMEDLV